MSLVFPDAGSIASSEINKISTLNFIDFRTSGRTEMIFDFSIAIDKGTGIKAVSPSPWDMCTFQLSTCLSDETH